MTVPAPLTFSHLERQPQISHGCFNRHGGQSLPPWDSLNCGPRCGDKADDVRANQSRIAASLSLAKLAVMEQVHGDTIVLVDEHNAHVPQQADAMICATAGIGLLIQQADCQAVLLFDEENHVVANVHVGWRGNVNNIIAKTIGAMGKAFGSAPGHILAAISPSLGPCCAQFSHFQQEFPASFHPFQPRPAYFDLWEISRQQLTAAGVAAANIRLARICTCCDDNFFSYRRHKVTGRCASVIGLVP